MTELDPTIAHIVQRMGALGHDPTSTVRTLEHNREVGGSPTSKHLTGEAADFRLSREAVLDILMVTRRFEDVQVIIETSVPHIHVEMDEKGGVIVEIPKHLRNSRGDRWLRIPNT